jgi:hypothetical protein
MGTKVNLELKGITEDEMERINKYLRIHKMDISDFVEDSLRKYLITSETTFEDSGDCPNCYLKGQKGKKLKGLPLLEAEEKGLVTIKTEETREWARKNETFFVICLDCLWWGFPDKETIKRRG